MSERDEHLKLIAILRKNVQSLRKALTTLAEHQDMPPHLKALINKHIKEQP